MRRLLRRLAWLLMRLVLVVGMSFLFLAKATSHHPPNCADFATERLEDSCLPLFLNSNPRDLAARVEALVATLRHDSTEAHLAELHRLGGASLPIFVPRLSQLPIPTRNRLAWAMLPVLRRMNWRGADQVDSLDGAYRFLSENWHERSVDYRQTTVERWVQRLSTRGGAALTATVLEYDTYALPSLMASLPELNSDDDVERARRLVDVARRVTGLPWAISPNARPAEARPVVEHWRRWWQLHSLEYQIVSGPSRWSAVLRHTQFGQWTALVFNFRFGTDRQHRDILEQLLPAGLRTLALILACVVGTVGVAVAKLRSPLGLVSTSVITPVIMSVPPIATVIACSLLGLPQSLLTACVVACVSMAALELGNTSQATSQNFPGANRPGVMGDSTRVTRHVVPEWLFAGHRWPWLLTLAFCAEKAFGVLGIGATSITAFRAHDLHLLMAVTTMTATWLLLVESAVQFGRQMRRQRSQSEAAT